MLSSGAVSCKPMHPFSCLFNKESNSKILNSVSILLQQWSFVVQWACLGTAKAVVMPERKINGARFSCSHGV